MHDRRHRILQAARKIIASKGYERATIKEISEQAGVAFGLLHYHFENKENLFLQVIRSLYDREIGPASLDQLSAKNPDELATLGVGILKHTLKSVPDFFHLIYESISVARQSEHVRDALQAMWLEYRRQGVEIIQRPFDVCPQSLDHDNQVWTQRRHGLPVGNR